MINYCQKAVCILHKSDIDLWNWLFERQWKIVFPNCLLFLYQIKTTPSTTGNLTQNALLIPQTKSSNWQWQLILKLAGHLGGKTTRLFLNMRFNYQLDSFLLQPCIDQWGGEPVGWFHCHWITPSGPSSYKGKPPLQSRGTALDVCTMLQSCVDQDGPQHLGSWGTPGRRQAHGWMCFMLLWQSQLQWSLNPPRVHRLSLRCGRCVGWIENILKLFLPPSDGIPCHGQQNHTLTVSSPRLVCSQQTFTLWLSLLGPTGCCILPCYFFFSCECSNIWHDYKVDHRTVI